MRVRFFQPSNETETAEFLAVERRITEFWSHFRRVQHRPAAEWVTGLRKELKAISPGLGLEVDQQSGERRGYVLPVDGLEYTPLAEKIVAMATGHDGWLLEVCRPPLTLEAALARVGAATRFDLKVARARVGAATRFDLKVARARVGVERGHALAIVLGHHLFQGTDDELGTEAAEWLVSGLVGDALFDRWICSVRTVAAPRPSPLKLVGQQEGNLPIAIGELSETILTAVSRIVDTLPEAPLHEFCERADWVLFEVEELRGVVSEHPLPELRVATTMCPEMLKSFLSNTPFASERFSRHGERFAYVELDTKGRSQEASLELRNALEEALDYALVPGRLGCVVGAGVGETCMYLFLALQSVDLALRLVLRKLHEHGIAGKSRVRFCDDEWRGEWIE